MPDLDSLTPDQRLALLTAAKTLQKEFTGVFSTETIELFLRTSYEAMGEVGISIATEFPKPWTDEILRAADVGVTMGYGDACPIFPGKRYEDWELDDPGGLDIAGVRPIRDEIGERVRQLLASLQVPVG
jgi:protein-tyrosine-phosphatase